MSRLSLKSMDAFGFPILLNFRHQHHYKTTIGGFLTLLLASTFTILFFYQFYFMLARANVKTQFESSYRIDPPLILWNKTNFIFSILYADRTLSMNNSIFLFNASYHQVTLFPNGTSTDNATTIPLRPCHTTDFDALGLLEYYQPYNLQTGLCPDFEILNIQGNALSPFMEYIEIDGLDCVNGSNPNIVCATPDFISQYQQNHDNIDVQVLFTSNNIDNANFDKPSTMFLGIAEFSASSSGLLLQTTVFFKKQVVTTYSDVFGLASGINDTTAAYSRFRQDIPSFTGRSTGKRFQFYMKSFNYLDVYTRNYATLIDILGMVGGTLNMIMLFMGLMARYVSRVQWKFKLASTYFPLEELEWDDVEERWITGGGKNGSSTEKRVKQIETEKIGRKNQSSDWQSKNEDHSKSRDNSKREDQSKRPILQNPNIELTQSLNRCHHSSYSQSRNGDHNNLPPLVDQMVDKSKNLSTNQVQSQKTPVPHKSKRWSFFAWFCFGRKYKNKADIVDKAFDIISKSLDSERIVAKIQEIDILKKLLLNPSQLNLLDLAKFHMAENQVVPKDDWEREYIPASKAEFQKYYGDYVNVKSENDKVNTSLLKMLDPNILDFYENMDRKPIDDNTEIDNLNVKEAIIELTRDHYSRNTQENQTTEFNPNTKLTETHQVGEQTDLKTNISINNGYAGIDQNNSSQRNDTSMTAFRPCYDPIHVRDTSIENNKRKKSNGTGGKKARRKVSTIRQYFRMASIESLGLGKQHTDSGLGQDP